ncbi:MAG: Hsp20/alpha crystallin family protein [Anaerolineae bacterium]|nr:Hsp20/alpha crystallin family protein [Anaerolineae bacterium]
MELKNLAPWRWGERKVPVRSELQSSHGSLQLDFDRLFDDFFTTPFGLSMTPFSQSLGDFNPTIDVSETDTEFKVSAELPGLSENDIDVSVDHNILTISGEKKAETEDKRENYYRVERSYGSFRRSIELPGEMDPDQIEATFKNGVLSITMPKPEQDQAKRITVKTS